MSDHYNSYLDARILARERQRREEDERFQRELAAGLDARSPEEIARDEAELARIDAVIAADLAARAKEADRRMREKTDPFSTRGT